ncbi:hypothetical protein ACMXYV_17555 [Neptuniibacter sp. SY11_33]|uniref:hypothetical protein n=1 Tax=Neptuniibacter sp. SY11_33 TaxID=3398215 RepID=UPI0039F58EC4
MRDKYHLGLAAFIAVISCTSFVAGALMVVLTEQYDKSEEKKRYEEVMSIYEKTELYPDLFNIRMKLEILQAIESDKQTDWDRIADLYRDELGKERTELAMMIGTFPREDWEEAAQQLAKDIDEYILNR